MRKIIISSILITLVFGLCISILLIPETTHAAGKWVCPVNNQTHDTQDDCNKACKTTSTSGDTYIQCSRSYDREDIITLITTYRNWFMIIVGILDVMVFVYAAFLYMTARGKEDQLKQAKKILLYGVVALVILVVAGGLLYTIQNFLVPTP